MRWWLRCLMSQQAGTTVSGGVRRDTANRRAGVGVRGGAGLMWMHTSRLSAAANSSKRAARRAGDVNGDGVRELLLQGTELSGTGGSLYFLYQRKGTSSESLSAQRESTDAMALIPTPRFDILPVARGGYHDIRLSVTGCFKWNGTGYVPYETSDYHALQPSWFDAVKARTRRTCSGRSDTEGGRVSR